MKRSILLSALLLILFVGWSTWANFYTFDADKAAQHMRVNGKDKSIHCCAWFTMRGLHAGGCPAVILPAQWYSWFMPLVRFDEVSTVDYHPQMGDVVVFERPAKYSWKKLSQWWGHVAMYDGDQWVSDFKQKRMNPYRSDVPYKIYRFRDR